MNQEEIKKAIAVFYPALLLESIMSRETRERAVKCLEVLLAVLLFLSLLAFGVKGMASWPSGMALWAFWFEHWQGVFLGSFLMAAAIYLMFRATGAFYDSYYFIGLKTVLPESGLGDGSSLLTFEAALILQMAFVRGDLTGAFAASKLGRRALVCLGLGKDFLADFFSRRAGLADPTLCAIGVQSKDAPISFKALAEALVSLDREFTGALSVRDISAKDFAGAADWVERVERHRRFLSRFWGKDSLGRIQGIGKDWSYGGAYTLEKFAQDITGQSISSEDFRYRLADLDSLEAVLARSSASNALLVSEEGAGALDTVFALGSRISDGSVLPPLEHKRIFLFDANDFVAAAKDKAKFESQLLHIFDESVRAGNIILVFSDLPGFLESAKGLGSDLVSLMDPYLASPHLQVIAVSNPGAFHQGIEGDSRILHRFEKILVKEPDASAIMRILENQALVEESRSKVFFTYQSLEAVAEGVKRYFTEGVSSDRAVHLLTELAPAVLAKGKNFAERSDVLALIESKTGIKTGAVSGSERDTLLHLEELLHQRIIGQDKAVKAISGALRRARSDIENPERPMGSFLFLGPTGVGKTETTKALAATFFGSDEAIIRLDMSEYQTNDSLKRLIGSFEDGKPGVLSSKLREQSYGVLLLDEFEKTNSEVLNLFLQILDEGFFSDMAGKRVNARNLIIIATSNAGSDLIWNMMREGKNLAASKDAIVNEIINRGIFKPELLNRFDGVILFHPLSEENLWAIAGLMLKKLQKRLTEKGIELVINDALLNSVVSAGTDPEFGARPMNRAIQEKVEQVIAQKILQGVAKPGSKIELTDAELA